MNDWNNRNNQSNQSNQSTRSNQINQNIQSTPNNQSNQSAQGAPGGQRPSYLFLPQHGHYRQLRVYRVAEALYDLTYLFCQRFLPAYGDRTVDQMVQAARSGKQNIAEGNQAAATSSETEIKLTNVARASIEELLDDYEDYLRTRSLPLWGKEHPRQAPLRRWTRSEAFLREYKGKCAAMTDEELANLGITLCHQTIYMLGRLLETQQQRFVEQGGIKERMYAARTGYRQQQEAQFAALQQENETLRQENEALRQENESFRQEAAALRQRIAELEEALKQPRLVMYQGQQE